MSVCFFSKLHAKVSYGLYLSCPVNGKHENVLIDLLQKITIGCIALSGFLDVLNIIPELFLQPKQDCRTSSCCVKYRCYSTQTS
jgi:hypothetical protein